MDDNFRPFRAVDVIPCCCIKHPFFWGRHYMILYHIIPNCDDPIGARAGLIVDSHDLSWLEWLIFPIPSHDFAKAMRSTVGRFFFHDSWVFHGFSLKVTLFLSRNHLWLVVWNMHFPYIGNFIIPTDFHILQRGRLKPPSRKARPLVAGQLFFWAHNAPCAHRRWVAWGSAMIRRRRELGDSFVWRETANPNGRTQQLQS